MNTAQINAPLFKAPMLHADFADDAASMDFDPEWDEFLALGNVADPADLPVDTAWRRAPVLLSY